MSQLSLLLSKPVLNVASSCIIGKVSDVYFDEYLKNAVYFCIEKSADGSTALLAYSEAQSILDAVAIADDINLISPSDVDLTSLRAGVMNMDVYTPNGADKGKISDIVITSGGKVSKLQTSVCDFTPSAILALGNVILLKNGVKNKPRKLTIPRPETEYPVYILNDTEKVLQMEKSMLDGSMPIPKLNGEKEPVLSNGAFEMLLDGSNAPTYDEDAHTPTRVICDYDFLLGRTLGADLLTYTGELIALKNSTVTDKTVEKARRAGKLVELTLNSIKVEKQN